jgi:hypothetical protein
MHTKDDNWFKFTSIYAFNFYCEAKQQNLIIAYFFIIRSLYNVHPR